jgi:hypothetical protein
MSFRLGRLARFRADFMPRSYNPALEPAKSGFDCVRVDVSVNVLPQAVIDGLVLLLIGRSFTSAAEEMIAELKQESESSWECGRVAQLRILKRRLGDQAAEGLTIRMPDIRSRELGAG